MLGAMEEVEGRERERVGEREIYREEEIERGRGTKKEEGWRRRKIEHTYLFTWRWKAETWSGGRAKKSDKMVGGIDGERDEEEGTRRGSQVHTKQQTEGTERKSAATNEHRAVAGDDSAVSMLVV